MKIASTMSAPQFWKNFCQCNSNFEDLSANMTSKLFPASTNYDSVKKQWKEIARGLLLHELLGFLEKHTVLTKVRSVNQPEVTFFQVLDLAGCRTVGRAGKLRTGKPPLKVTEVGMKVPVNFTSMNTCVTTASKTHGFCSQFSKSCAGASYRQIRGRGFGGWQPPPGLCNARLTKIQHT